jgi:hypothetical protein
VIPFFWIGETLALSFVYAFFIFSYHPQKLPDQFVYPMLMVLYVIYWEHWVYKNFFKFLLPDHVVTTKELLFTMMITFFPLIYIVVDVFMLYFKPAL